MKQTVNAQLNNAQNQGVSGSVDASSLSMRLMVTVQKCASALDVIKEALPKNDSDLQEAFRVLKAAVDEAAEIAADLDEHAKVDEQIRETLAKEIIRLKEQTSADRKQIFGTKSEKSSGVRTVRNTKKQSGNENNEEKNPHPKRGGSGVKILPENCRKRTVLHRIPEDKKICAKCGTALVQAGWRTRERINVIIELERVIHKSEVCKCPHCAKHGTKEYVVSAEIPASPIPGSFAEPALIADVLWSKMGLGLPFHRMEQMWKDRGYPLSRQTMTNWASRTGQIMAPIYQRLHEHAMQAGVLHGDETRLQVLHEDGKTPESQSYVWGLMTAKNEPRQVLWLQYQPDRKHKHAHEIFDGFTGLLHTDAYGAYGELEKIEALIGCWAHARRRFKTALDLLDRKDRQNPNFPEAQGFTLCNCLYALDHDLKDASPEERVLERARKMKPFIAQFKCWLHIHESATGKFGEAVRYTINNWNALTNFLDYGEAELDNNRMERNLRSFVTGRKNWLFAVSTEGADALSVFHSILGSARLNDVNPQKYLEWLLEHSREIECSEAEELDRFMPWSFKEISSEKREA